MNDQVRIRVVLQVAEPETETVWHKVLTLTPAPDPSPDAVRELLAELEQRIDNLMARV